MGHFSSTAIRCPFTFSMLKSMPPFTVFKDSFDNRKKIYSKNRTNHKALNEKSSNIVLTSSYWNFKQHAAVSINSDNSIDNEILGQNTLETLPGTVTPPQAVYSPRKKITDSCVSITSTPSKSITDGLECELVAEKLAHCLKRGINYRKNINKKVCFAIQLEQESKKPVLTILDKRPTHMKNLARRKWMYKIYRKAKLQKPTNKVLLASKGMTLKRRVNPGDLLF